MLYKYILILCVFFLNQCKYTDRVQIINNVDTSKVYNILEVDQMPEYIYGNDSAVSYFKKFFPYEVKFAESYNDYIIVQFTIDTDGVITNVYIQDTYQSEVFLESIRKYLKKMEKWKPGQIGNSRVKTKVYYPFYWALK